MVLIDEVFVLKAQMLQATPPCMASLAVPAAFTFFCGGSAVGSPQ